MAMNIEVPELNYEVAGQTRKWTCASSRSRSMSDPLFRARFFFMLARQHYFALNG